MPVLAQTLRFSFAAAILLQSPPVGHSQLISPMGPPERYVRISVGVEEAGTCLGEQSAFQQSVDFDPFAAMLTASRVCEEGQAVGSAAQISRIDENSIFMRATLSGRFSSFQSVGPEDALGRSLWDLQFSVSRRALFRLRAGVAATLHALPHEPSWTGEIESRAILRLDENDVIRVDSILRRPGNQREDRTELIWLDAGTYTLAAWCHLEAIGIRSGAMGSQEYASWLTFTLEHLPCPGDVDGDRDVDVQDLTTLLANFSDEEIYPPGTHGDIDGDEFVTTEDLSFLLGNFGATCTESP